MLCLILEMNHHWSTLSARNVVTIIRHFTKVDLNHREILIWSQHHLPVPKVLIEIEKSVETWNFWQVLTACLDLDWELVNFITFLYQDFSICQDFWAWSISKSLDNVEISGLILKSLDKSWKPWQSQFISTISMKISTQLSLNSKVSILTILTKTKNLLVSTVSIILTSFKSWSQQIKKSWSRLLKPPSLLLLWPLIFHRYLQVISSLLFLYEHLVSSILR